jgi:hypothetical protein
VNSLYPKRLALHEKLRRLAIDAERCPLTLGDGLHQLTDGGHGYGVLLLLLSLVNAVPVPSFGLKSLLGVVVALLGLQMFAGKRSVWLPRWFIRIRLRPNLIQRAASLGERFLPIIERFVKPRRNWMKYRLCASLLGLIIILMGLVMMLPIPGTKILTSPVLLSLSLGLIENDGLLTLLAALTTLVLVALYAEGLYLLVILVVG